MVSSGDPGLSQDDPYGVGASHPPQQQSPSPPLSDRAYGKQHHNLLHGQLEPHGGRGWSRLDCDLGFSEKGPDGRGEYNLGRS